MKMWKRLVLVYLLASYVTAFGWTVRPEFLLSAPVTVPLFFVIHACLYTFQPGWQLQASELLFLSVPIVSFIGTYVLVRMIEWSYRFFKGRM